MLSPNEFITSWGNDGVPLLRFPKESVASLTLAKEDKEFLVVSGLPEDAAPFLSFQVSASGEIPTVAQAWGLPEAFRHYRMIGSDGAGNPIALDESHQGEVVALDQENRFTRVLMNSTIRQLAESLLAYRKLVQDTQAEFGVDAFLDGKTSAAGRNDLRQTLTRIDPAALQPGCFWHGELQNLEANAG